MFQGSPLENITTTKSSQDVAPQYLTDYQQDVINLGKNAVQQGGVAGLSPLTQQAINMAPQAAFAGATSAGTGQDLLTQAGYTGSNQIVQNYMNPYTQNVVEEMARLSGKNQRENIMPALDAASIASGNFGSGRMANVQGQTLADIQAALTGQQYGALSKGYTDAMSAASNDLNRGVQAGSALNQTAQTQSQIGQSGLKSMADLGGLAQTNEQAKLDYPMSQASKFSQLMQGQNVPTGKTSSDTAPGSAGQYGMSGLQEMIALYALYQAMNTPGYDASKLVGLANTNKAAKGGSITSTGSEVPEGAVFYDEDGNFYDAEGNQIG
jgi:hypothetical protein